MVASDPPITVEVITYAPTVFRHCQHCEVAWQGMGLGEAIRRAEGADSLPDDLAEEYAQLSDWVHGLLKRYGSRLRIRVVDAASVEGVVRSIRHGVRRYPAVIVGGRDKRIGTDFAALDPIIESHLDHVKPSRVSGGDA